MGIKQKYKLWTKYFKNNSQWITIFIYTKNIIWIGKIIIKN